MSAEVRAALRERAEHRCEYCRLPEHLSHLPFHAEHIVAVVHEPNHHFSNLAWACPHCNWHKGPNLSTIDSATGKRVDLFNPRKQAWTDHFELQADGHIFGSTACGRGTVELLKMNLQGRVEIRLQLLDE